MEYLSVKPTMLVQIYLLTLCLIIGRTDAMRGKSSSNSGGNLDYGKELSTVSDYLERMEPSTMDPLVVTQHSERARRWIDSDGEKLVGGSLTAETVDPRIHSLFGNDDDPLETVLESLIDNNVDRLKQILDSLVTASKFCDKESLHFLAKLKSQTSSGEFLRFYIERLVCVCQEQMYQKDGGTSNSDRDINMGAEIRTLSMYLNEMEPNSMDRSIVIQHLEKARTLLNSDGYGLVRGLVKSRDLNNNLKFLFSVNSDPLNTLLINIIENNLNHLRRILISLIKASRSCDQESLDFLAKVKGQTVEGQFLNAYIEQLVQVCREQSDQKDSGADVTMGEADSDDDECSDMRVEIRTVNDIVEQLDIDNRKPSFEFIAQYMEKAQTLLCSLGDKSDGRIKAQEVDANIEALFGNHPLKTVGIFGNSVDHLKRILDSLIKGSRSCDPDSLKFLAEITRHLPVNKHLSLYIMRLIQVCREHSKRKDGRVDVATVESSSSQVETLDLRVELNTVAYMLFGMEVDMVDPSRAATLFEEVRRWLDSDGERLVKGGVTMETVDARVFTLFDNDRDQLELVLHHIKGKNLDHLRMILDNLVAVSESCNWKSLDFLNRCRDQIEKGAFLDRYIDRLNCKNRDQIYEMGRITDTTRGKSTSSIEMDVDLSAELRTLSIYLDELEPHSKYPGQVNEHLSKVGILLKADGEKLVEISVGKKRKQLEYDLKYEFRHNPDSLETLLANLKGNNLEHLKYIVDGLIKASEKCDSKSLDFLALVQRQTSESQFLHDYSRQLITTCQEQANMVAQELEGKFGGVSDELVQVMADLAHLSRKKQGVMAAGRDDPVTSSNLQSHDTPNEMLEDLKQFGLNKKFSGYSISKYIHEYYQDKLHLSDDGKLGRKQFLLNFLRDSLHIPCSRLVEHWTDALKISPSVELSREIVFKAMEERRIGNISLDKTLEVVRICQDMLEYFGMAYSAV